MNDEEIDDVLTKAARAPDDLKPETLQRVADSIKRLDPPGAPAAAHMGDGGRTGAGLRGRLASGRSPRGILRICQDGFPGALAGLSCARSPCLGGGQRLVRP